MASELIYTSAPNGVFPGSSGYCTVAMSETLTRAQCETLEKLSVYQVTDPMVSGNKSQPEDASEQLLALNPYSFSHVRCTLGRHTHNVLFRTGVAGLDYSGRLRKLSHFLILNSQDRINSGPAWIMSQSGVFVTDWREPPGKLPERPSIPTGDVQPVTCKYWGEVTGDPGWAGWLAASVLAQAIKPSYFVIDRGVDALRLISEAIALLDPVDRWRPTFSSLFNGLPAEVECHWRFIFQDSNEYRKLSGRANSRLFMLKNLGYCDNDAAAKAGRDGIFVSRQSSLTTQFSFNASASHDNSDLDATEENQPSSLSAQASAKVHEIDLNAYSMKQRNFMVALLLCSILVAIPPTIFLLTRQVEVADSTSTTEDSEPVVGPEEEDNASVEPEIPSRPADVPEKIVKLTGEGNKMPELPSPVAQPEQPEVKDEKLGDESRSVDESSLDYVHDVQLEAPQSVEDSAEVDRSVIHDRANAFFDSLDAIDHPRLSSMTEKMKIGTLGQLGILDLTADSALISDPLPEDAKLNLELLQVRLPQGIRIPYQLEVRKTDCVSGIYLVSKSGSALLVLIQETGSGLCCTIKSRENYFKYFSNNAMLYHLKLSIELPNFPEISRIYQLYQPIYLRPELSIMQRAGKNYIDQKQTFLADDPGLGQYNELKKCLGVLEGACKLRSFGLRHKKLIGGSQVLVQPEPFFFDRNDIRKESSDWFALQQESLITPIGIINIGENQLSSYFLMPESVRKVYTEGE